jgi:hypothetical protein
MITYDSYIASDKEITSDTDQLVGIHFWRVWETNLFRKNGEENRGHVL